MIQTRRRSRTRLFVGIAAGAVLGLIFLTAGLGKLPHQGEYWGLLLFDMSDSLQLQLLLKSFSRILPWFELILGLLLLIGIAARLMACLSSVLIFGFVANNIWMIVQGAGREPCGCFGVLEGFLGTLSAQDALFLDLGMLGLVVITTLYYPSSFFDLRPGVLNLRALQKKFS